MQTLWKSKLDWDENVLGEKKISWVEFQNQLVFIEKCTTQRKIIGDDYTTL